jgi:hypothetical protein
VAITPPKKGDKMNLNKYKVTLIVGNEYELIVKATDYQNAYDIAFDWDETEENSSIINTEEIDVGRTVKTVEIFNDICSCCQQTTYDCEADSERAFQIKDHLTELAKVTNSETSEYLLEVLDAFLTHTVNPCNAQSRA